MQQQPRLAFALALVCIAVACSSSERAGSRLKVGVEAPAGQDGTHAQTRAGSGGAPANRGNAGTTASAEGALGVRVHDRAGLAIELVTLQCAGDCVDIEAVAHGGNPPYVYRWEDGSLDPKRTLCLTESGRFTVSATDTSIPSDEFHYDAQTVEAEVSATVLECVDGGVRDAGVQCVVPAAGPACDLGNGISLPEEVTVDIKGAVRYFAGGAALPAGQYRLTYVDGCNTYGSPSFYGDFDAAPAEYGIGWTVHGSVDPLGIINCSIVGNDDAPFLLTPGTVGIGVDDGGFATYSECVAANCGVPPVDFDYAGGKLGLMREPGGALGAVDDLDGSSEGGRAPTFRLTRLDTCP